MMTEKDLISKLQKLDQIKPRQNWVVLTKREILGGNPVVARNFKFQISNFKLELAYAFATFVFIMVGMFGFAQYTMPGDMLFPVKKITEQGQAALSGQTALRQDVASLGNRINELTQMTKQGRTANIPSAIEEVRQSASKVAESLRNNLIKDTESAKELAGEVQKIKELQTLADLSGTPEMQSLNDALAVLVQNEILDLEKTTLLEDQQKILQEVKDLFEAEDYASALEKILMINN